MIRVLLDHNYLSPYDIAERCGMEIGPVSKTLSDAFFEGEAIERIKKKVVLENGKNKSHPNVWCYRKAQNNLFNVQKQLDTVPQND